MKHRLTSVLLNLSFFARCDDSVSVIHGFCGQTIDFCRLSFEADHEKRWSAPQRITYRPIAAKPRCATITLGCRELSVHPERWDNAPGSFRHRQLEGASRFVHLRPRS